MTRIAEFLELDEDQFIQTYTRLNQSRTGLALEDQPDGACIFLEGSKCKIQTVKPQQCRDFPNLWNFPGFQDTCEAIPKDLSPDEFKERILQTTGRDVPVPNT
jgi:Fe-S-cluster containining protein